MKEYIFSFITVNNKGEYSTLWESKFNNLLEAKKYYKNFVNMMQRKDWDCYSDKDIVVNLIEYRYHEDWTYTNPHEYKRLYRCKEGR